MNRTAHKHENHSDQNQLFTNPFGCVTSLQIMWNNWKHAQMSLKWQIDNFTMNFDRSLSESDACEIVFNVIDQLTL